MKGLIPTILFSDSLGTNDQYELGDLSGKYGSFLGMMSYNKRHVDYNLPLFGYQSIIGRSVVIHRMKQDGNKRHVCANLVPDIAKSTFYMKTKTEFKGPEVFGMILMVGCGSFLSCSAGLFKMTDSWTDSLTIRLFFFHTGPIHRRRGEEYDPLECHDLYRPQV